jgi:hypothetical protein
MLPGGHLAGHRLMNALTDEQRTLLTKLASITETIEGHKGSPLMLEPERMQLQTQLRLSVYCATLRADA